ncbi:hypothetical protein PG994_003538 [Apiospora phragmitis]|uniref:2EXR domain-containing protein n=1 Tax=Apiospora phragmitis TaxID=2905665 RepID=A0ABR1W123_9PEZI
MDPLVKFPKFPPEIRAQIWEDAICDETEERVFFVSAYTLNILPTKINISPLLSVSVEARRVTIKHYNVRIPIYRLPPLKEQPEFSFLEWIDLTKIYVGEKHWAHGVAAGVILSGIGINTP